MSVSSASKCGTQDAFGVLHRADDDDGLAGYGAHQERDHVTDARTAWPERLGWK
jgi:hypothetical protein